MRKIKRMISITLLSTLFLGACTSAGTTKIKVATGGTTGTYYAYSGVVAQALSEQLGDIQLSVHSTGASKANIFEIADGDADMAIVQNDVADYAFYGTNLFETEGAVEGFSALGGVYREVVQIVTGSDITSVADLAGKNVSIGDAGSGVEFNAVQILEAYGLSTSDIQVQNLSFGDSAEAIKDGKIDAFFCVAGTPTTAIVELATTKDIHILSIDAQHLSYLEEKYPFYTEYTIPAGSYSGVDTDTVSVAVKATYIVSDDLSEDVVYRITKALFENADNIAHDKAEELDPAYAVEGISFPFHPGAEKYFKEVGVLE